MFKKMIVDSLTHKEDKYNGYRSFDIERLNNLINSLADKVIYIKPA